MSIENIALYQHVFDLLTDPILVIDRQFRYLIANQAYLDVVNLPREKVVGACISQVEGEDAFRLIKPRVQESLKGAELNFPSQVYSARPVDALLHINLTPLKNDVGQINHVLVVMRQSDSFFDEDRGGKYDQYQLSRSLASSPNPIIMTSLIEGKVLQLNKAGQRLLGYSAEELIGKTLLDYMVDTSYRENLVDKLKQEKHFKIPDLPMRHKNGKTVHIEVVLNLTSFNGTAAILGFCRDRTDELAALKATQDKTATLRLLRKVAVAANEANNLEMAIKMCLEEICKYSDWPIGHALLPNQKTGLLESSDLWHFNNEQEYQHLKSWCAGVQFGPGDGIPGKVLSTKKPVFLPDASLDDGFPRSSIKEGTGIQSAFAFPVIVDDQVLVVMEFVSPEKQEVSKNLSDILKPVAIQLGRVIERQRAQLSLQESNAHYQRLVNDINAIVWESNIEGNEVYFVSASVSKILGYNPEQFYQSGFWANLIHPDDQFGALREAEGKSKTLENYEIEYRMLHADGSTVWIHDTVHIKNDSDPANVRKYGVMLDITEKKNLSAELEYQAAHDSLTGLYNRDAFDRRLRILLSTDQPNQQHALCYLDLDQFKVINDACGHLAGDTLLHQLGAILSTKIRRSDMLARLGGDEFGIIMENCSLERAGKIAEDLRRVIQDFRFVWEQQRYNVGVSIGLIPIDEYSGTVNEIMSAADMACYAAKDAGRNRIRTYHPNDLELTQRRREMDWVSKINMALEQDRLHIYIQPIQDLQKEQKNSHFEVLVRMISETGEIIPPGAFLPAAERYTLSTQIDQWVINKSLSWLGNHQQQLAKISMISINLSGLSLGSGTFLKFLLETLRKSTVPCEKICFEVTETAAISNLSKAIDFITQVKAAGCLFALDDFGSGLSSFNYLKNLPVDFLKIDGAFVRDITSDPIDYEMVRSINEIGHVMGKLTIAEFVEDEQTLNALRRLGVDYAQGYFIGKPIPLYKKRAVVPLTDSEPNVRNAKLAV